MNLKVAVLAVGMVLPAPNYLNAPKTAVRPSQSVVEASQKQTQPTPKPEDYYIPLNNYLKQKGSPLNGQDFYEVGQQYKIDPDVLIAITQAETNLGKVRQRGSSCNVGSVGSYDSTNTTANCSSPRHGIELIAQTLNNKMLGHKTAISQLSRASEPYGAVYAESRSNWRINVLNTLKEIKGKPMNDQYAFRLDRK